MVWKWNQFMPQAPGPPRCSQPLQALGKAGAAPLEAVVAKTDNCLSNSFDWQFGHCGSLPDRTRVSNRWPHAAHAYS